MKMGIAMATQTFESFHLPSLSYIDAKWEEPNLRSTTAATTKAGLAAWLSRQVAAFIAARRESAARTELFAMSDRELMDIGIARADLGRVFDMEHNADLRMRGFSN